MQVAPEVARAQPVWQALVSVPGSVMDSAGYSVVIATYNYGRFLGDAIESVLAQTLPAREIIVVDDGSTDDTPRVLGRYSASVTVIRQSNAGQAAAWNAAFPHVQGEWVTFLDADDWWYPERMERLLAVAAEPAGVIMHDLVVSGADFQHDSWLDWAAVQVREGWVGEHTVAHGLPWIFVPTSGTMFRRTILDEIFPLHADRWRSCADAVVLHRAALRTELRFVAEPLGCYRLHGQNSYHQQGWYDGDDEPRIILANLLLAQRLAREVNCDLAALGRPDRAALWRHPYYSRMIGWVSGRRSWLAVAALVLRQRRTHPPEAIASWMEAAREAVRLHRYQRARDHALGPTLRELARHDYPELDLRQPWAPSGPG